MLTRPCCATCGWSRLMWPRTSRRRRGVQVVRGLSGFRGDERGWRSWLFTTARRQAIDEVRRRPGTRWRRSLSCQAPGGAEDGGCRRSGNGEPRHRGGNRGDLGTAAHPGGGDLVAGPGRPGHRGGGPDRRPEPWSGPHSCAPRPAAACPDPGSDGCNAVTGRGVSDGDMPIFPWPARGGDPHAGDSALDALLAGNLLPEDAADGLRSVAEAIAALNTAPATSELAAEASALAVFRGAADMPAEPTRSRRDRKSTRLNSSHVEISYAVFCLKKKKKKLSLHCQAKKKTRQKLK